MAANKVVRIKVWGPTKDRTVPQILDQVKAATNGVRVLDAKELGPHGDEERPQPHDKEGRGAAAGAVITVTESELEKLTAALSQVGNIQFEVEEAA